MNFVLFILMSSTFLAHASIDAGEAMHRYFPETRPPGIYSPMFQGPVDWSQPPLGCVEEMVPHPASVPCLDLTQVKNPLSDWPSNITPADQQYWYGQRRALTYCRSLELLRREAATPGSQTAGAIELSWMGTIAVDNYTTKVNAIYEASDTYGVPAHVLTGAVYQESLFAELGIAADGGNYSCGVEQINLIGWCNWANAQSAAEKQAMNWPAIPVNCGDPNVITLKFIKPFYDIALTHLNGLPEYRLQKQHFQNIALQDVQSGWPSGNAATNALRYQTIMSFINNCSDPRYGILAKANELRSIYTQYISPAFQNKDRYSGATRFQRQCLQTAKDNAYPLHSGWVMAVGAYNAGPRSIDAVTYYNEWDDNGFNDPLRVGSFTPDQIISSIYWSGKYNPTTDKIDFANREGAARTWNWYVGCVNQRHVARVMQNVTLITDYFVNSLEGAYPCAQSTVDPNGNVITSVPPQRQTTSGVLGGNP